jgi:hypothetical protein
MNINQPSLIVASEVYDVLITILAVVTGQHCYSTGEDFMKILKTATRNERLAKPDIANMIVKLLPNCTASERFLCGCYNSNFKVTYILGLATVKSR